MTHADIVRVFTYNPTTEEQDKDLKELHDAACELATVVYRCVNPQAAQQAIQQLGGLVSMCRTAIEVSPRQVEKRIQVVS